MRNIYFLIFRNLHPDSHVFIVRKMKSGMEQGTTGVDSLTWVEQCMLTTDRIKELFRLSSIYTVGKLAPAVIGFLLYPIYTRFLTPAQFGIIGLALLVGGGSKYIFSLGTNAAAFNFYHRYKGTEREEFYTTLFAFILTVSVGWLIVFEAIGPRLFRLLLDQDLYDPYFRIILLATAITTTFHLIPRQRFRAAEQAKWFVAMDFGRGITNHAVTLLMVITLSLGVTGYLLGSLAASILVGLGGFVAISRWAVPHLSVSKLRGALAYSVPLFPHFYSHFIISMADRVLLARLGTLDAVGIYTIGYTLANSLYMVVTSGNSAIMPEFARAGDDEIAFDRLATTTTYYLLFAAIATVGFSLFMPVFVRLFFPASYQNAVSILPWLAVAFFSVALYNVPMNVLSQTQRETNIVPLLTVTAAGANIGLNFILIPPLGIVGAAISTLGAYFLLALLVFGISQRINPVRYKYTRTATIVIAMVAIISFGIGLPTFSPIVDILSRVAGFGLFFLLLTGVGFWNADEKAMFQQALVDVRSRL